MDFDRVYEDDRAELYVALALATGSRDLATDTVDEAFRVWHSRVLRGRLPKPAAAAVMWEALKRIVRLARKGAEVQQGFRLRTAPLDEEHRRTLRELRTLPLAHRTALILERHTGWEPEMVGAATQIEPETLSAIGQASIAALGRNLEVDADTAAAMVDRALTAEASGLREPLSRLAGVKSAGMLQRVGRIAAGVGVGVLGVFGLVAGVNAIDFGSDAPEAQGTVASSSSPTPVPTGPPTLAETEFEWVAGALPIRPNSGDIRSIRSVGSGVVLVGMEYTDRPQAIVARSDDGLDWELLGAPFVGDGDIVGLAASEDLFVAAGNRWTGEGSTASLYVSTDGFDWIETPIPTQDAVTVRDIGVRVFTWVQSVNVIGEDIIVSVQSNAELDERFIAELVPGGLVQGGWGLSEDGVQVFDRAGQGTFFSWDDLGLSEEEIAIVAPGSRLMTTQDRGETWSDIGEGLRGNVISVAGTPELTGAVVSNQFGPQLWIRTGGEWTQSRIDLHATSLATHGGQLYTTGFTDAGSTSVWRSTDGETWEVVLDDAGDGHPNIGASSAGLAVWTSGQFFGRVGPTEVEIDGYRVQLFNEGGIRVFDPDTGDVVAELSRDRVFSSGGTTVVENDAGEPLFELSPQDLEVVLFQEDAIVEPGFPGGGGSISLFVSENGLNWKRVVVEGLLPESFAAFTGAPLGDGVALLGWDQRGEGQQMWIGTPAA